MNPLLLEKQRHLDELDQFLKGCVYGNFIAAQKYIIGEIEKVILETSPRTEADWNAQLELRGERNARLTLLTFFETVRATLKDEIDKIVDSETQSTETLNEYEQEESDDVF